MKRQYVLIIVFTFFIGLSISFILNPSLYSSDDESSTLYHKNPLSSKEYIQSEENIQSLQELLDIQRSIVLNIKSKNFNDAKKDFEEYKIKSRQLNDAVYTLHLNQTTMANFNRENQKNMIDLGKIIRDSEEFDEVNRQVDLYEVKKNRALQYSFYYKSEAILTSLIVTITQFREREPDILEISKQLNLNISQFSGVDSILEEIITENQKEQEEWGIKLSASTPSAHSRNESEKEPQLRPQDLSPSAISLAMSPTSGRYGEILQLRGASPSSPFHEVTLFLDGSEWKVLQMDKSGVFSTPLQIGMIRSGKHVVFATSGTVFSNLVTFTVIPIDTKLTLWVKAGDRPTEIFCTGILHTDEIPVTDATIRILVDNFEAGTTITNHDGSYSISLKRPGNHTYQAIFDDSTFPLNPSESKVQSVMSEQSTLTPVAIIIGLGVTILGFLGGTWYLKKITNFGWKKGRPEPSTLHKISVMKEIKQETGESSLGFPTLMNNLLRYLQQKMEQPEYNSQEMGDSEKTRREPVESSPNLPDRRDILTRYRNFLDSGESSKAAYLLYQSLIRWLMPIHSNRIPFACTPREFANIFASSSIEVSLKSFIARYEEIRYQGQPLQEEDILLTYLKDVIEQPEVEFNNTNRRD